MTARTQITPVQLIRDSAAVTEPAATAAVAAGMYVQGLNAGSPASNVDLRKLLLRVIVGTTATVVTLRATGNGVDFQGNAQTSPYPSNAVYSWGSQGDLVSASITSNTLDLGPFTTDRFNQIDSSGNTYFYLDFSQVTSVSVIAYLLPFNLV